MAENDKKPDEGKEDQLKKADVALIADGCKAFGIDPKFLFASSVRVIDGEKTAVLVTNGGAKVFYKKGDKPEPLDPIRVDGIIRKKMKPVTGKKKG